MKGTGPANKKRGYRLEALVVKMARERGLRARRAWGSNGQAIGLPPTVDVEVEGIPLQCKNRKKLASYITPEKDCEGQVIKEDYQKPLVVLPLERYLDLVAQLKTQQEACMQ